MHSGWGRGLRFQRFRAQGACSAAEPRRRVARGRTFIWVKSGDTLYEIAGRFGVSVNALKAVNGLSGSSLRAGQKLVIPATAENPALQS